MGSGSAPIGPPRQRRCGALTGPGSEPALPDGSGSGADAAQPLHPGWLSRLHPPPVPASEGCLPSSLPLFRNPRSTCRRRICNLDNAPGCLGTESGHFDCREEVEGREVLQDFWASGRTDARGYGTSSKPCHLPHISLWFSLSPGFLPPWQVSGERPLPSLGAPKAVAQTVFLVPSCPISPLTFQELLWLPLQSSLLTASGLAGECMGVHFALSRPLDFPRITIKPRPVSQVYADVAPLTLPVSSGHALVPSPPSLGLH